jgi:hypothetical protein
MCEEFDYFADRPRSGTAIHSDGRHGPVEVMEAVYEAATLTHESSFEATGPRPAGS